MHASSLKRLSGVAEKLHGRYPLLTQVGFYPVAADTSKKRHTVPKECSCPNAGNSVQNSNVKPSR